MKIPQFLYRSPVIRYDPLAEVEIFERRNTTTGEVSYQVPSAVDVKALQDAARRPAAPAAKPGASDQTPTKGVSLIV
jgi:hypothetical protein